jgi:hypothetical protein
LVGRIVEAYERFDAERPPALKPSTRHSHPRES